MDKYSDRLLAVKKCLQVLRTFKDSGECPEKLKGTIGNLIGEVKKSEHDLECPPLSGSVERMIREYEADPVIRAYIEQREDWKDKLRELKSNIRNMFDDDDD